MAEARSPGLPRYRTFQPEPGPGRQREEHAELLASGKVLGSGRPLCEAAVNFLVISLLREALAFFVALVFPLLSAPVWLFSSFCVPFLSRAISSSPISAWAWACGAALISAKLLVRASCAALALVFSPLRLLILLLEWRWPFRVASQPLDASWLIYPLLFFLRGSEIFLVSERTRRVSRLIRIERGGFLGLHLLVRKGDLRRLRQRRVQPKCENAPLRRRVTERAA